MVKKEYTPKQIVKKLGETNKYLNQRYTVDEISNLIGVPKRTLRSWFELKTLVEIRDKYYPPTDQEGFELEFIGEYLEQLPPEENFERTGQSLYGRLVEEYVMSGMSIKLNFEQFYALLEDNFTQIDGLWFKPGE